MATVTACLAPSCAGEATIVPIDHVLTCARPVKIWTDEIADGARRQLENVASLPFIHHHVAVMPDVHWGMGATIGSVIPTLGAVIPAAVGVDLGCGMTACRLDLDAGDLPDGLGTMRQRIEAAVPHGRTDNGGRNDRGAWSELPADVASEYARIAIESALDEVLDRHPAVLKGHVNKERHLGTLGTGNHFIELCLDEADRVWVMLHSGSRGIGNRIGTYFIALAKKDMERWFIALPDTDLAYFPEGTEHFGDYVRAVAWAQRFAKVNRALILRHTLDAISATLDRKVVAEQEIIDCHHNYIAREQHFGANVIVTRKGAIRAREGDLGIIPGSMGASSFIVRGKGSREAFHSCSHGAGRRMGRREARRRYTARDLAEQTAGIECPKDDARVDEIPAAYKPIDRVMENQSDLVDAIHTLRQILNVKG